MTCPLCGFDGPRRRVLAGRGGALAKCPRCRLVTVDPMPSRAAALALYDAAYFRGGRGYVDYLADEPVFRREFRRRLRHLRRTPAPRRLLEVGCATGAFLDEARRAGFTPRGVEPCAAMAAVARERTGLPVDAVAVEEIDFPAASFEAIVLFEVLEHLTDPVGALRRLRELLAPGGLLALSVPDFGGAWARACGRFWPLFTPWEHLFYFTRETLRRTLAAAGLPVVRFRRARTSFSVRTAAARLGLGAWHGPPARWGIHLPFGTLFAVAQVEEDGARRGRGRA